MLEGGRSIIHLLPSKAGSAADISVFFLFNNVVGDGQRAHFTQSQDDRRFYFLISGLRITKADLGCLGAVN